ncbi:hypothetical protein BJ546DRAFT_970595 [Cryomyces antarcticus]
MLPSFVPLYKSTKPCTTTTPTPTTTPEVVPISPPTPHTSLKEITYTSSDCSTTSTTNLTTSTTIPSPPLIPTTSCSTPTSSTGTTYRTTTMSPSTTTPTSTSTNNSLSTITSTTISLTSTLSASTPSTSSNSESMTIVNSTSSSPTSTVQSSTTRTSVSLTSTSTRTVSKPSTSLMSAFPKPTSLARSNTMSTVTTSLSNISTDTSTSNTSTRTASVPTVSTIISTSRSPIVLPYSTPVVCSGCTIGDTHVIVYSFDRKTQTIYRTVYPLVSIDLPSQTITGSTTVISGVTLTYPTGYAQYAANGLFGGVDRFTQVDLTAPATCTATRTSIVLPASTDAASFFYAIPSGDINLEVLPPPFLDYLMEFPTVQEQFAYQNLSKCRDPDSSTNTAIGNTQVIVTLARVSIATGAPTLLPPPPDSIPTTTAAPPAPQSQILPSAPPTTTPTPTPTTPPSSLDFNKLFTAILSVAAKPSTSPPIVSATSLPSSSPPPPSSTPVPPPTTAPAPVVLQLNSAIGPPAPVTGSSGATVESSRVPSSSGVLCLSFSFDTGINANNSTGSGSATVKLCDRSSSSGVLCLSSNFDTGINANNSTGSGSATVEFCDRSFNFDIGIKANNSTGSSGATVESSRVPSSSSIVCPSSHHIRLAIITAASARSNNCQQLRFCFFHTKNLIKQHIFHISSSDICIHRDRC